MKDNVFVEIFHLLAAHYGPQHWWPGETKLEILVGAVLTQNTNWSNVVKAIDNLKASDMLSLPILQQASIEAIAQRVRPAGYYNLKARRLVNLLEMIREVYGGELNSLLDDDTGTARRNLLSVKGVGPETADAILLYAGGHPLFVVDAYTHRVFCRHQLVPEECDYHELQEIFTANLPADAQLFNEYHALIVRLGKDFCKKNNPLCRECPLHGVEGRRV
ncbi:MAG: endonuclease III domain-containing protein [Desulfopila sp.]